MTIWNRFKVTSVLFGLTAVIVALVDFFLFPVDFESAYSPIVFGLLFVVFWIAAPVIAKRIKI